MILWETQTNFLTNLILLSAKSGNLKIPSRLSSWDFPGGPVVKNPPSNAGDSGLNPDQRTKIPQLSPRALTTEPMSSGAHAPKLRPNAVKKTIQ